MYYYTCVVVKRIYLNAKEDDSKKALLFLNKLQHGAEFIRLRVER